MGELQSIQLSTLTPEVGDLLTVTVNPDTEPVSFQWFQIDSLENETPIPWTKGDSYAVRPRDVGYLIKVVATSENDPEDQVSVVTETAVPDLFPAQVFMNAHLALPSDPIASGHAATKSYVDRAITTVASQNATRYDGVIVGDGETFLWRMSHGFGHRDVSVEILRFDDGATYTVYPGVRRLVIDNLCYVDIYFSVPPANGETFNVLIRP
jgi:hypothetical protein